MKSGKLREKLKRFFNDFSLHSEGAICGVNYQMLERFWLRLITFLLPFEIILTIILCFVFDSALPVGGLFLVLVISFMAPMVVRMFFEWVDLGLEIYEDTVKFFSSLKKSA